MKKQPIFVAVDTHNQKRASEIINATKNYIYGVKFGLEFFFFFFKREPAKIFTNENRKQVLDFTLKNSVNTVYIVIKSVRHVKIVTANIFIFLFVSNCAFFAAFIISKPPLAWMVR